MTTFSGHARERMAQLDISEQDVLETIADHRAFRGLTRSCMRLRKWIRTPSREYEINLVYDPSCDHVVTVGFCNSIAARIGNVS